MRKVWRWFILLVIVAGLLAACSQPESEGEKLLEQQCTSSCHEKSKVVAVGRTHDGWSQKVDVMITFGAELTEEEREILVEYLAETYEP